ncbi:hypothetical protein NSIN_10166 [Nitrosotalea sinensis]|uniref:Uncharacterized protein n=1 Tax=Nitrosotalea sinensis TaxID=1499975 RepID=A0A2H1EE98_9ARCH|nr:hypothetical protein NSIN_10166 [Candidatus Nitrosotalea sinensis]
MEYDLTIQAMSTLLIRETIVLKNLILQVSTCYSSALSIRPTLPRMRQQQKTSMKQLMTILNITIVVMIKEVIESWVAVVNTITDNNFGLYYKGGSSGI